MVMLSHAFNTSDEDGSCQKAYQPPGLADLIQGESSGFILAQLVNTISAATDGIHTASSCNFSQRTSYRAREIGLNICEQET